MHGGIGFPEVTVPIVLLLRKAVKGTKQAQGKGAAKSKEAALAKALVERVEESAKWAEQRRKGVLFAPGKLGEVDRWEDDLSSRLDDTPLGRYVKVQRKAREKRRKLIEKVRAASVTPSCPPSVSSPRAVAQSPERGEWPLCGDSLCRMLIPIPFRSGAAGRGRDPRRRLNAAALRHGCVKLPVGHSRFIVPVGSRDITRCTLEPKGKLGGEHVASACERLGCSDRATVPVCTPMAL